MLFDLLRMGSLDENARVQLIMNLGVRIFVILCVLPIHEFAHAFVADKLGDRTARLKGRLTMSPFEHIDPIGALMILLCGFGYAKPVPVNIRNFRKKRKDDVGNIYSFGSETVFDSGHAKRCMAAVAFAGPLSNIIMAFISLVLLNFVIAFAPNTTLWVIVYYFFQFCASININLAVFNLLPIPPLDGSRIISVIIPDKYYFKIMQYERYIRIAVIVLLFTNVLTIPLSFLSSLLFGALDFVASLPFSLFN